MGGGFAERFDDAFSRVSSKMSAFEAFQRLVYMTAYETATACGQETSGFRDIAKAARSASEGQMEDFAECLAWYWAAIEEEPFQDFLGSAYMRLGIGNEAGGQFFTPYHICKLMAEVEVGGMDLDKDVITVSEPSCGAGANCIALCGELHGLGVD